MERYEYVQWKALILCWRGILATKDLRSYLQVRKIRKKSIPVLVKATGNVTVADAAAVNTELESFCKKNGRKELFIQH